MLDVEAVKAQFLAGGQIIISGDLGQAGQPWQDAMPLSIFWHGRQVSFDQDGALGTWSDKAHLAPQNIQQLGQFVQGSLSQQAAVI